MQTLSPIFWFQFFSKEEDVALRKWEAMLLQVRDDESTPGDASCSTGKSGMLPQGLQWVAQIYDPTSAALWSKRTKLHVPFHTSMPCDQSFTDGGSHVSQADASDSDEGAGVGLFETDDYVGEAGAGSNRSTQGRNKCVICCVVSLHTY